jgi:hypothetical protein
LREVRALEAVAEIVRASTSPPRDDLHVRRERTRLLAAYDRELVAPPSHWLTRRRLVAALAVGAMMASFFVFWRLRRDAPNMSIASGPAALVYAESAATWSRRWQGDREEIVLQRGALSIHVDHSWSPRPVLVRLPDGELEDIGTTFSVNVQDGRTTRVAVEEGSVVLRVRGQPSVVMGQGAVWTPDQPSESPASARVVSPATESVSSIPASSTLSPRPPASTAFPPHPRSPLKFRAMNDAASAAFREAIGLLDDGDDRKAEQALLRFLARYPRDQRSEDAGYLRVIALQRCGDDAMMKQAAREYLLRHPSGLHRGDLERLLAATGE